MKFSSQKFNKRIFSKLRKKRIGVLYGGRSQEREISIKSGKAVLKALKKMGFNTVGIDIATDLYAKLKSIDFAFLATHGPFGEDGTLQGMLELMEIPYTGSGLLASALCMNKIYTKQILKANGIPTPPWIVVNINEDYLPKAMNFSKPFVVKPSSQGSTLGVSIVTEKEKILPALKSAFKYDSTLLLEKYIPGKELTVGILDGKPLPIIEIIPVKGYYDFECKYVPGKSKHIIPAEVKNPSRIQKVALQAFKALGCKSFGRVDIRYDGRTPYVLELNTIPGMTELSLLPEAAKHIGLSFEEMILRIIASSVFDEKKKKKI